jgi:hypothetical protein
MHRIKIIFYSGYNKRRSGSSRIQVTYLKVNFRVSPNDPRALPNKIIKFWLVQTSAVWNLKLIAAFAVAYQCVTS